MHTGEEILSYKLVEKIGTGTASEVWLGLHKQLNTKAAIKILRPELTSDEVLRKRFQQEAGLLATLDHPNIVRTLDYTETEKGQLYLVLEYVEGKALNTLLEEKKGVLSQELIIKIIKGVLDGVGYAHRKNVSHRDLKPSEIIVKPDNQVKILDFGIAIAILPQPRLTRAGTPRLFRSKYTSPELIKMIQGDNIYKRSDIYSIGVILWHLLTGREPYEGLSDFEIETQIVQHPLPPPSTLRKDIAPWWDEIVARATDKQIGMRYQTCEDFAQALLQKAGIQTATDIPAAALKTAQTQIANPTPEPLPETQPAKNNNKWVSWIVAAVILISSGLFLWYWNIVLHPSSKTPGTTTDLRGAPKDAPNNQPEDSLQLAYAPIADLRVQATETRVDKKNPGTFSPRMLLDNDPNTVWKPKPKKKLTEYQKCTLTFTLPKTATLIGIQIHPGISGAGFSKALRLQSMRLLFSDGSSENLTIQDKDSIQQFIFSPRAANFVKLIPVDFYPETATNKDWGLNTVRLLTPLKR
jgi:serine/threonine protein kinase